ncbi:MAG: dihydroorotase [bacterium]|nr:dihydroorotase [bacterium]MDD5353755.1 dihydroorotase [bacterium]MDD5757207.1 dihydroorotase [bacterium]
MRILIKGGRVIDPANRIDAQKDIYIEEGVIKKVSLSIKVNKPNVKVIDARGKVVTPGLIDMHTHLREPGREDEETIASGTRAACKGGFTSICCMPNTQPVTDNQAQVELILSKSQKEGWVNIYPIGAITKGLQGEEMSPIGELKKAGVAGITDDGKTVENSLIMRRALEYSKMFKLPVISHCEDKNLSAEGLINEGYVSTILGMRGIPRQAEEVIVSRDIQLAEMTGGHLHIAHVSTEGSVGMIRRAKRMDIKITAETAPHYFTLTDEAVKTYNTNTKMNPPLRTKRDVQAIKQGLQDGTIDCIASDHAPHLEDEKNQEYELAPFGIIGLETMLPLVITELVDKKVLTLREAIKKLTVNPAHILGLNKGTLSPGADADITIIDTKTKRKIETFESQSNNSPFIGYTLRGFAVYTIVGGRICMAEGELVAG